jgi:hypothetical protein
VAHSVGQLLGGCPGRRPSARQVSRFSQSSQGQVSRLNGSRRIALKPATIGPSVSTANNSSDGEHPMTTTSWSTPALLPGLG